LESIPKNSIIRAQDVRWCNTMHKNRLFQKIMGWCNTKARQKHVQQPNNGFTEMSIIYKREIYLSILSLLLSVLLLLFFMYKNYRYIVQRQKSSRDPFCCSNDRFDFSSSWKVARTFIFDCTRYCINSCASAQKGSLDRNTVHSDASDSILSVTISVCQPLIRERFI